MRGSEVQDGHDEATARRELRLTALCHEDAARTVRFLTGAVMACGGWVLVRRFFPDDSAEMEFEFPRATCVEMYSVLIAAGLELIRESHVLMADLCQCTKDLIESKGLETAGVDLRVLPGKPGESREQRLGISD
ncbi:hypothetical protein [Paracidobacterium acidisoli]|uniref:Uncharacterized protein n=1 Tax=Paracidobacterium acidisoli TaxID=2303751 RepID=A0A372IQ51_9BACT|nr:hypothetical protein [Paracidobacterium acidisoli]MBT9331343.1 hypothetical protein [Paracidobacterium acidisoli]